MKKILSWIMAAAMVLGMMPALSLTANAAGNTHTLALPISAGSVLLDGYTYTVSANTTITAGSGVNGLTVADNATVVIYIPSGVTLTVTGGNGSAYTGGGAGIYLPSGSTLIVTGKGTLNATGGSGGSGGSGGGAGSGVLSISSNYFYGGTGGAGGKGAGGGGAGIGTTGGAGGNGGGGGAGASYANCEPDNSASGANGGGGSIGGSSGGNGALYLLGGVVTTFSGGSGGSSAGGGGGGFSANDSNSGWSNAYTASGGGGGGGGGAGASGTGFGTGGGGGGGGGGGSGGARRVNTDDSSHYIFGLGQGGFGGQISGGSGTTAYTTGSVWSTESSGSGGSGGSRGTGGVAGSATILSASTMVQGDAVSYPAAASYALMFDTQGATSAGTTSAVAVYGIGLSQITPPAKAGYTFAGYYTAQNGGTQVYHADGTPAVSGWETAAETTLYAGWTRNFYALNVPEPVAQNGVTASVRYSAATSDIQDGKYAYGATVTATVFFDGTAINNAVHKVLLTGNVPIAAADVAGKSISVAAGTHYVNQPVAQITITVPANDGTTMSLSHALTIPLSLYNVEKTYTGSPIAYSLGGSIPGVTGTTITYTGSGYGPSTTAPTDAGTYGVVIQFTTDEANGYEPLGDVTRTLTVKPATLSWDASGLSAAGKDYDGSSLATLSGSLAVKGSIGTDEVSLDTSYTLNDTVKGYFDNPLPGLSKTVTVDTSHLRLTGANAANYTLPSQGPTLTATITGVAPTVVVVISSPESQSYDGETKPVSGIAKFYGTGWLLLNGAGDANLGYTYYTDSSCASLTTAANSGASEKGGAPVDAGQYYVKATYTPGTGQEMYQTTVSEAVAYSITPQEITAVVDWASGSDGPYIYRGSAFKPEVTVYMDDTRMVTLQRDDAFTVAYEHNTNAGTAQAVVTLMGNYSIAADTVLIKDFMIEHATYDMTKVGFPSGSAGLPYDKASHDIAVYPLLSFFSANDAAGNTNIRVDDVTAVYHYSCAANGYDSEVPPVHAGVYTVTATYTSANQNYHFDNGSSEITKTATLTIQQVTPGIIVFPTVGTVTTGNTLSLSTLGEGYVYGLNERITGVFAWTSPETVLGMVGVPTAYGITFTPDTSFAADYTAVSGTVSVTPMANTYALGISATGGSFGAVDYQAAGNTVTYTVTNNSTIALTGIDAVLGGTNADRFTLNKSDLPATLETGDAATVTVTSLTSETGTFGATITVSATKHANDGGGSVTQTLDIAQTVNKLPAPAFSWPDGSYTAYYGQTLGSLTLTIDANGVFSWADGAAASVGGVGSNPFVMAYTPDNLNYDYSGAAGWDSGTNTARKSYTVTVFAMGGALTAPLTAEKVAQVFGDGAIFTDGTPPTITLTKDIALSVSVIVDTDVTIDLNGHTITAPEGKPAILVEENDVDITLTGTGGVTGGKGTNGSTGGDGSPAIDFGGTTGGTVTVGTGVIVTGGKGGNGTSGTGGNGGAGISGNDVDITVNGTATGGVGGAGSTTGGYGGSGVKSQDGGITITGAASGGTGGNGTTAGGPGGNGASNGSGSITVNGSATVVGGDGGSGGTTGGNGGNGVSSTDGEIINDGTVKGGSGGSSTDAGGKGGEGIISESGTVSGNGSTTGGTGGKSTSAEGVPGVGGMAVSTGGTDTFSGTKTNGSDGTKPTDSSGGGGGSSSSGSSTSVIVIVDGKKYDIGTQTATDTETIVTVDSKQLADKISDAEKGSKVEVIVSGTTSVASAHLTLQNLKDMASKELILSVQTGGSIFQIPANYINVNAIATKLGTTDLTEITVSVLVTSMDDADIATVRKTVEKNGAQLVGSPLQFAVQASFNGKTYEVPRFSGYTTRTIAITSEQAQRITTAVVMENSTLRHVPTSVYQQNSQWYADIHSLTNSIYAMVSNEKSFTDADGKWYKVYVNEMGSRMIISGVGNGLFDGERSINRAEFAAIVVRALGLPGTEDAVFTDIDTTAWYSGGVNTAYAYGIIQGRGNGIFDPDAHITREEAMAMIQRSAQVIGLEGTSGSLDGFADVDKVASWALEAVRFNVGSGLIVGSNGKLNPEEHITRAETSTVILRLLQKAELIDTRGE